MHVVEVAPLMSFTWTLLMQVTTLLILFLVLRKFFFEKVHKFVEKRQDDVKATYDKAEEITREANRKLEDYEKKIDQIEAEARDIIKDAKLKADNQAKIIVDEAGAKASELLAQTEKEIERQKNKAIFEMKNEIAGLAISIAEKIIERNVETTKDQELLIEKAIKEVGNSKWQN